MAAPTYSVYIGSETGLLKGIDPPKHHWDNLNTLQAADKSKEIVSLCFHDETESNICIGLKNKSYFNFDVWTKSCSETVSVDCGSGNLKSIFPYNESFITGTDNGIVNLWKDKDQMCEIKAGNHLHCMTQNYHSKNNIGTGGKQTDLKIWDIENPENAIFAAKNVKNDWLNLEVPVWVTGIGFLSTGCIVTSTGHHQVRVYDPKTQRRPILDMTFDEYPLTAMALRNDNQVVVGNTQGKMGLLDIRKGKLVQLFKGFAGSIRSLHCHPVLPYVASCGLDRFVRIHDLNTKQMLYKIYLKSRLNFVLMARRWKNDGEDEAEETEADQNVEIKQEDHDTDDEDDDIWGQMEVVKTKVVKRTHGSDGEEEVKSMKKANIARKVSLKKGSKKKKPKTKSI